MLSVPLKISLSNSNTRKAYKIKYIMISHMSYHVVTVILCSNNLVLMQFHESAMHAIPVFIKPFPVWNALGCLLHPYLTPLLLLRIIVGITCFRDILWHFLFFFELEIWPFLDGFSTSPYAFLYFYVITITNRVIECELLKVETWVNSPLRSKHLSQQVFEYLNDVTRKTSHNCYISKLKAPKLPFQKHFLLINSYL